MVEDAITGKKQDIEKHLLYLTMDAKSDKSGGGLKLPKWVDVTEVRQFVPLLLGEGSNGERAHGGCIVQPVLLRAEPGTGKTWSLLQLFVLLAAALRESSGATLVPMLQPMLIRVQRLVRFWKPETDMLSAYIDNEYRCLCEAPDGRHICSGSADLTIRIWDLREGVCARVLEGHVDYVFGIAFSPNGTRMASVDDTKLLIIWDATRTPPVALRTIATGRNYGVSWSADSKRVFVGGGGRGARLRCGARGPGAQAGKGPIAVRVRRP